MAPKKTLFIESFRRFHEYTKEFNMSKIIVLIALLTIPSLSRASESTQDILECTSSLLGAPSFKILSVESAEGLRSYRIVKKVNNPLYGPYILDVSTSAVTYYGGAFILTVNHGRSGYAHVFSHGDVSVIDIDLFLNDDLNTNGPLTNFKCSMMN